MGRKKESQNEAKHGLNFKDVALVMSGPCLSFQDLRRGYDEERFITIGFLEGRMVVMAHTPRDEKVCVISMRKANSREQKTYKKRFEAS